MKTITTRGLAAGSLFKLLFLGSFIPFFLFGVLAGIGAFFGQDYVMVNDNYQYGILGLIWGIVIGILLPLLLSALVWILLFIGLWLWTRFKPIDLTYKE